MINITTHQGAERAIIEQAAPVRRIGPRGFALLLGLELLLLVGVLIWAVYWLTPQSTPFAPATDLVPVAEAVRARLSGSIDDPLIEVRPGLSVRESNLRGFKLGDSAYFYYLEGATNFDPLSRGAVSPADVEVLLRDESGPQTLVIYRII